MTEPLASFENIRFGKKGPVAVGTVGSPGTDASATTSTAAGVNADVDITSQVPGNVATQVTIEYPATTQTPFNFPGRTYTKKRPASVSIDPAGVNNSAFIAAKTPGSAGNDISVEVIGGSLGTALDVTVQGKKITVQLATTVGVGPTTTVEAFCDAINNDPEANDLVEAYPLAAAGIMDDVAETFLAGGLDTLNPEEQVLVWAGTDGSGDIGMTGAAMAALISTSPLLLGTNAGTGAASWADGDEQTLTLSGGSDPTGFHSRRQDAQALDDVQRATDGHNNPQNDTYYQQTTHRRGNTSVPGDVTDEDRNITEAGNFAVQQTGMLNNKSLLGP